MKKVICTVFDEKSGVHGTPFFSHSQSTAIRDFTYATTQDPSTQLYRYPVDFHLFSHGTYDDESGEFDITRKEILISGASLASQRVVNKLDGSLED